MGYGQSGSRFTEEKARCLSQECRPAYFDGRNEPLYPLHALRAFGEEVAGVMELGMVNRNVHSEITTFVGKTVDSELSGNMIDICPVGALTSNRSVIRPVPGSCNAVNRCRRMTPRAPT